MDIASFRSKLFVPGTKPELFDKAIASNADALSFDLEDSVVPGRKDAARKAVASFIRGMAGQGSKLTIVRVNGRATPHFDEDLKSVVAPGLDCVNLPKVECREDILESVRILESAERKNGLTGQVRILANIETPKGLRCAHEIASAHSRVMGLQLGFVDLLSATGIDGDEPGARQYVRIQVRLAAAEAGIDAYDTAFPDFRRPDLFRADAEAARKAGFAGKSCIHPAQIEIANEVFSPRPDEVARARSILAKALEAAREHQGAFAVDGRMVDEPIIEKARRLVALAERFSIA